MASKTIHVVVAFKQAGNVIEAEPPRIFHSAPAGEAAAKILSHSRLGVIAWSRYADPAIGEYGEPEELVRFGTIPDWFDAGGGVE